MSELPKMQFIIYNVIYPVERSVYEEAGVDCKNLEKVLYHYCQSESDQFRHETVIQHYYEKALKDEKLMNSIREEMNNYREENDYSSINLQFLENESEPILTEMIHWSTEVFLLEDAIHSCINDLDKEKQAELLEKLIDDD